MVPKSKYDANFFGEFQEKISALMPIFCQKKVHSRKTTMFSSPYFVKECRFSQKYCALIFFFHEKPPAVMPIFGQKNVNSVKTTLYYGPTKVNRMPFFSDFSQTKNCSHAHIFSKKSQFSKNHTAIMPI